MGATLKKYIWILGIVCTVVISFLFAKIANLFIEGTFFPNSLMMTTASDEEDDVIASLTKKGGVEIDVILKRNFFDAKETIILTGGDEKTDTPIKEPAVDPVPEVNPDPGKQVAVQTKLNIKLFSTFSVGDGRNEISSCVAKVDRETATFKVKDKEPFGKKTKILRILARRVEFLNNKKLEYVELERFVKAKKARKKPTKKTDSSLIKRVTKNEDEPKLDEISRDGDSFKIPRKEVDNALNNIAKLYTDIRAVPYFKDGKPQGFKLLSVKRGTFFEKLGLRRGDILVSINDRTLDIQTGMETFKLLQNESEFKMTLERRGEEKQFNYEIVN
ncbi:hypothetical protein BVY03_00125 [bacterium K02(2017)]|nr:hypothetical protein BVY03_00125 [bacterium K02(2017)]